MGRRRLCFGAVSPPSQGPQDTVSPSIMRDMTTSCEARLGSATAGEGESLNSNSVSPTRLKQG